MDIAPLKTFATRARTDLIKEVGARLDVVLAPGSSDRLEQPRQVDILERLVAKGGRESIVERVAYTWFNRIIALRFMDANGYTGVGVVSPEAGHDSGQPEVLANAKAGSYNTAIVPDTVVAEASALIAGSRPSPDPQGEAYGLLLEAYCHHWHQHMDFMFEKEADYTELLVPTSLLSADSVRNRAVKVLTKDVCKDVEVIGWLYQFYISERKDEVFAGFKKNKKAGADEIPAATQLFTPHWIVRYLVENSLGRLWMLNRPSSGLASQMDYYIASVDEETDFLKITKPEELKVIDPACGSGHMLTYAFDLLYAIYEEEGHSPADIPGLILTHNLYGTEIDPRAGALAAFALTMKARAKQRTFFNTQVEPNICVIDPISFTSQELELLLTPNGDRDKETEFWNQFREGDTRGSLVKPDAVLASRLSRHVDSLDHGGDLLAADVIEWAERVIEQVEYLSPVYSVAVANPPYMGGKSLGSEMQEFVKKNFAAAKADLYAAFIDRCGSLVRAGGLVAMVTMQSWMFLSTYEKLRRELIETRTILTMAHLGANAFDTIGGEVVSTTAFVMEIGKPSESALGIFLRLTDGSNEAAKASALRAASTGTTTDDVFRADARQFEALPGAQIAYWLPESALVAYRTFDRLDEHTYGQPGLQTSDNARFIRQWFEVSQDEFCASATDSKLAAESGARWFPLVKGGDFRKWYGNLDTVVNWKSDGREIKTSINEKYPYLNGNIDYVVKDRGYFFRESITYNRITAGRFAVRYTDPGTIFDVAGSAVFPHENLWGVLGFLCSTTAEYLMRAQNPTFTVQSGDVAALPYPSTRIDALGEDLVGPVQEAVAISRSDWDSVEMSWSFARNQLLESAGSRLAERVSAVVQANATQRERLATAEGTINRLIARAFDLGDVVPADVLAADVTLRAVGVASVVRDLVSYAVGCMFGRYSIDEPGLILADQGSTLQDYLAKVPTPTFTPDTDNVIPIVDGDWFEDDVVERFRGFLKSAFGEDHFEENLTFVTESLGVKNLRDYFVKSFYKDHVQLYKKRPIYWLFSSPKGSFNALIYLHRYNPTTVSTVLNEYLRAYQTKLDVRLTFLESQVAGAGSAKEVALASKEAEKIRAVLVELKAYETELYQLAQQQIALDLDDGVKANYGKFGKALKNVGINKGGGDE